MPINTYNLDNITYLKSFNVPQFDLVYGDCIYESKDFTWTLFAYKALREGGVFIVQTDWHTDYLYRIFMEESLHANFINHLVWKNEWGNHPKNKFHQCYDDVLVFSKGKDYPFHPERIQVPKATANTKLNPSGRTTKTATAWIDDICLTTTSKERVKKEDGHLIKWQKPLKLYDRIISPFLESENNSINILDPFMGSGSLGVWCKQKNLSYTGIEIDKETYDLALQNIYKAD